MSRRGLTGWCLLVLLASSCSAASPASSPVPGGSVSSAGTHCPDLDIRGPSGAHVQLTGVWRGDDQGVYDILHRESCFHWLGMSADVGSGPGHDWTNVFIGQVKDDFTITGAWGDVPFNPFLASDQLGNGTLTLRIDFDQSAEVEWPVLRQVEQSGFFGGQVWVPNESLSPPTDLEGPFGGEGCALIEVNGERVELLGSGAWVIRPEPLSIQDQLGHIVARVGDPIRVHGQLSTLLGSGCTDTAIVVEAIDPTP